MGPGGWLQGVEGVLKGRWLGVSSWVLGLGSRVLGLGPGVWELGAECRVSVGCLVLGVGC